MNQLSLEYFHEDEIYLFCSADEQETDGPLEVFERLSQLQAYMATVHVERANQRRVIHGVLTPARFLPGKMCNKTPFIIVQDPNDVENGIVFESLVATTADLAEELESVIESGYTLFDANLEIEDVHILWGYEIPICLSVDEDAVDEETLEGCSAISAEVKKIEEDVLKNTQGG